MLKNRIRRRFNVHYILQVITTPSLGLLCSKELLLLIYVYCICSSKAWYIALRGNLELTLLAILRRQALCRSCVNIKLANVFVCLSRNMFWCETFSFDSTMPKMYENYHSIVPEKKEFYGSFTTKLKSLTWFFGFLMLQS